MGFYAKLYLQQFFFLLKQDYFRKTLRAFSEINLDFSRFFLKSKAQKRFDLK